MVRRSITLCEGIPKDSAVISAAVTTIMHCGILRKGSA
jgi:hypothetical protein